MRPQTLHATMVLALSKTICSFSQSGHFTRRNVLLFSLFNRTIINLTP